MASNLTHEEVELHLREKYNEMHGPGFFPDSVMQVYLYMWYYQSPSAVWINWLSQHGGDAYWAQDEPRHKVPWIP